MSRKRAAASNEVGPREKKAKAESPPRKPPPVVLDYNYLNTAELIGATAASALVHTELFILDLFRIIGEYAYEARNPSVYLIAPDVLRQTPFRRGGSIQWCGPVCYEIEGLCATGVIMGSSGVERLRIQGTEHVLSVAYNESRWSTYPLKVDGVEYMLDPSLFSVRLYAPSEISVVVD